MGGGLYHRKATLNAERGMMNDELKAKAFQFIIPRSALLFYA
jgi:hypothetical protein